MHTCLYELCGLESTKWHYSGSFELNTVNFWQCVHFDLILQHHYRNRTRSIHLSIDLASCGWNSIFRGISNATQHSVQLQSIYILFQFACQITNHDLIWNSFIVTVRPLLTSGHVWWDFSIFSSTEPRCLWIASNATNVHRSKFKRIKS